tara:strand:+ start:448 stop:675 length:228 start_codon:yes stop_codon:yes gene_type:complete
MPLESMNNETPIIHIVRVTADQITAPVEKHREAGEIVILDIPELVVIKGGNSLVQIKEPVVTKNTITPGIMTSAL